MKRIYLDNDVIRQLFLDGEVRCAIRYDGMPYRVKGCYMACPTYKVKEEDKAIGDSGVCCVVEDVSLVRPSEVECARRAQDVYREGDMAVVLRLSRTAEYRSEVVRSRVLKKIYLKKGKDGGVFLGGASQFAINEEAVIAESYQSIWERLPRDKREAFLDKVCAAHGVAERDKARSLKAWDNRKYVMPEVMPRRVRIVSVESVRAQDISDRDFNAMGVDWITNDVPFKRSFVGNEKWDLNKEVVIYRYE